MADVKLNLVNITDHSIAEGTKVVLARQSGSGKYYVYQCTSNYSSNGPTYTYVRIDSMNGNNNSTITGESQYQKYYFYLAWANDMGPLYDIVPNDYDDILQVRMDTGPVIVVEDDAYVVKVGNPHYIDNINVETNEYGCANIVLPNIAQISDTDKMDKMKNKVFVIAYRNDEGKYQLQGAISTKNDIRFPSGVNVVRLGLELFTNHNTNDSLKSRHNLELKIYAYTVNELPVFCHSLFPYFYQ